MGTQGIVSLVRGDRVIAKAIAGCNGRAALAVAKDMQKHPDPDINSLWHACRKHHLGCAACLIVMNETDFILAPEEQRAFDSLDIGPLYRETFQDPRFNPRWEQGTADFVKVVYLG